jgi:predicted TIM-barrel fold metal-dependent hydrolase
MAPTPRIFDCDNHYYEAPDAFTRHVPRAMQARCVQWAEIDGRKRHVVGGRVDLSVGNPLFDPVGPPGSLHEYYRGNADGLPAAELMRGRLEAQPACYRDPEARLATMDEQGVAATWLFPTLGVLYEELLKDDIDAVCTLFEAFNRWLEEDWGLTRGDRIFAAPYITLADPNRAERELEWALARDARIFVMRPAAIRTAEGDRSPGDPIFDGFWSRVDESGITAVIHTGNSGYSSNGYARDGFGRASIGMSRRPSVKNLALGRAASDFLFSLGCDLLFERFPNLRVASIENGSSFLGDLFHHLEQAARRNPWHFGEDPVALLKDRVYMSPFWEDDLEEVIAAMGPDRVLFGSDWPHMEGLPQPGDILAEAGRLAPEVADRFLYANTAALTERRVAPRDPVAAVAD